MDNDLIFTTQLYPSSHLKGGVKVAGVAHIKHPRAWSSGAPVTKLHLVTTEISHPGLWDLVQLPMGRGLRVRGGARVPVTGAGHCWFFLHNQGFSLKSKLVLR